MNTGPSYNGLFCVSRYSPSQFYFLILINSVKHYDWTL